MECISIIDLDGILESDKPSEDPSWVFTAVEIRKGLGSIGFLYVTNHGIPEDVISAVFSQSRQFFSLPPATKLKYKKDTSNLLDFDTFWGYLTPGNEILNDSSTNEVRESYDWLIGRGSYPTEELPLFESSIQELDLHCKILLRKLLTLIAIGLKVEWDYFLKTCQHFEDPSIKGLYNMKVFHYPGIPEGEAVPRGTVRCGEHTDAQLLTLLFQDEVGGLEVKTLEGKWIHAEPLPGSILVNTGDLLEFWTKGLFPATLHRISVPKLGDPKRTKSRYSIAFFSGPDADGVISPLEVDKEPEEGKRILESEKVYNSEEFKAWEHLKRRISKAYYE